MTSKNVLLINTKPLWKYFPQCPPPSTHPANSLAEGSRMKYYHGWDVCLGGDGTGLPRFLPAGESSPVTHTNQQPQASMVCGSPRYVTKLLVTYAKRLHLQLYWTWRRVLALDPNILFPAALFPSISVSPTRPHFAHQ